MNNKKFSPAKSLSPFVLILLFTFFINEGLLAQVKASFIPSSTSGCSPLTVNFENKSSVGSNIVYAWNFDNGLTSTLKNPSTQFITIKSYTVTLTVTNTLTSETASTSATITVVNGPKAEFSMDKRHICPTEDVTYTLGTNSGVTSFSWDFGDGNFGTGNSVQHAYPLFGKYLPKLVVSGPTGSCSILDTLEVYHVEAKIEFTDTNFCDQRIIYIQNSSSGNDNNHWDFGNGITSNEIVPYPTFNTGTYTLTLNVSNTYGCKDTTKTIINVDNVPQLELGKGWYVCIGDTVTLQAKGGDSILWSPSTNLSNTRSYTPRAYPTSSTNYLATITDYKTNCSSTGSIAVIVQREPKWDTIDIAPFPTDTVIIGDKIQFIVDSAGTYTYLWSPNYRISCLECASPVIQPLISTTYSIMLSDTNGCFSHTVEIPIVVREEYTVVLPDAFAPTSKNEADQKLFVRGWGIKNLIEFRIYNRWGIEMFFTDDITQGWDGTYKNKLQNMDTYIYYIKAEMWDGHIMEKKGSVNLLQ